MGIVTRFNYSNLITFENRKDSMYHHFFNWVCGEFNLYLKDDYYGLKIYIPDGLVWIRSEFKTHETSILVEVKSKSSITGGELSNTMISLFDRLEELY